MTSSRILVTAPYSPNELKELEQIFAVTYEPWTKLGRPRTDEELAILTRETGADVVVVELDVVGEITLSIPRLRAVGCCRASTPNIDREGAFEKGIPVFTTPGRNAQAVAEWTLAAMLNVLRNLGESERFLRGGLWPGNTTGPKRPYLQFRGNELAEKTVCLLGYGAVSRRLAPALLAFDCRVIAVDPLLDPTNPPQGIEVATLDEAVTKCDILSVHLPVIPATLGLVSAEIIRSLKKGAFVVNSSRAAVIDMPALRQAFTDGHLHGVALDVFENEPPDAKEISVWDVPNAFITPHIAGATFEVERHHSQIMNAAVLDWWGKMDVSG